MIGDFPQCQTVSAWPLLENSSTKSKTACGMSEDERSSKRRRCLMAKKEGGA